MAKHSTCHGANLVHDFRPTWTAMWATPNRETLPAPRTLLIGVVWKAHVVAALPWPHGPREGWSEPKSTAAGPIARGASRRVLCARAQPKRHVLREAEARIRRAFRGTHRLSSWRSGCAVSPRRNKRCAALVALMRPDLGPDRSSISASFGKKRRAAWQRRFPGPSWVTVTRNRAVATPSMDMHGRPRRAARVQPFPPAPFREDRCP